MGTSPGHTGLHSSHYCLVIFLRVICLKNEKSIFNHPCHKTKKKWKLGTYDTEAHVEVRNLKKTWLVIPPPRPSLDPLPQSIQSARLSLQSSELAPTAPSPTSECCPPPLWYSIYSIISLRTELQKIDRGP
jgi:hypothetical protein